MVCRPWAGPILGSDLCDLLSSFEATMSHASKNSPSLNHDTTSTFSSTHHQTLTMTPPKPTTLLDHDTQVYYFKYFRQFWASGPAAAVAVIAGVSHLRYKSELPLTCTVSSGKCQDAHAIVSQSTLIEMVFANKAQKTLLKCTLSHQIHLPVRRNKRFLARNNTTPMLNHCPPSAQFRYI